MKRGTDGGYLDSLNVLRNRCFRPYPLKFLGIQIFKFLLPVQNNVKIY